MLINLKGLNLEELASFIKQFAPEKYRSVQILKWLYRTRVKSIDEMTDISKDIRAQLKQKAYIGQLKINQIFTDEEDGSRKLLFELDDNNFIESVVIPDKTRNTLCVSSQVGCKLNCKFCATGKYIKFKRHLSAFEIIDQILTVIDLLQSEEKKLTNIVFMGMGEPFDNYDNVMKVCDIMSSDLALGFAANRITVSTAGLPDGIKKFADNPKRYELAISLNAVDDETRSEIMPINKKYNLQTLIDSISYYYMKKPKNPLTLEYVLLDGINDSNESMIKLRDLCKRFREIKVNLIPHNDFKKCAFKSASDERIDYFFDKLNYYGIRTLVRHSKGKNISAACGQLANEVSMRFAELRREDKFIFNN